MSALINHELLAVEQVAKLFEVTPKTLNKMCCEGRAPGVKIGRKWKFHPVVVDAFLKGEYSLERKMPESKGGLWQSTKEVRSGISASRATDKTYMSLLKRK